MTTSFSCKTEIKIIYVHARNAILSGISPKGNRMIPPLNYDFVRKISQTHSLDNIIDHPIGIDLIKSSTKEMISHFRQNATSVFHP